MVWTDPPYGVAIASRIGTRGVSAGQAREQGGSTIANDDLVPAKLEEFLLEALGNALAVCRSGGSWFVAAPAGPLFGNFGNVLTALGVWKQTITWVKDSLVLSRQDYHYRHEPLFFGWTPGAGHQRPADRKQDSVWEIARPRRSEEHPTMKPVELIERGLANHTKPGQVVLDPFSGSGSTLMACEAQGRRARLLELDPRYCDVIVRRWEDYTGQKAERVGGS